MGTCSRFSTVRQLRDGISSDQCTWRLCGILLDAMVRTGQSSSGKTLCWYSLKAERIV